MTTSGTLRVAMRPAWRDPNPYCGMLADALATSGVAVTELYPTWDSVSQPADILLLHWPNEFFIRTSLRRTYRGLRSLAGLLRAKLVQRKKVVWIVHNLAPHDRGSGKSSIRLAIFLRTVDGLVFLSEASRALAYDAYPLLAGVPSLIIPHGDYRAIEQTPPALPQPGTGRAVSLGFIGQIKPYKGLDTLAPLVGSLPASRVVLRIAGRSTDEALEDQLRAEAARVGNIELVFGYLDDQQLEVQVDAADAVILPYHDILNSGAALYALSRYRPVIAPHLGSLAELQQQVGDAWLYLYEGELTADVLDRALIWAAQQRCTPPDLSSQHWDRIAAPLASFLRDLTKDGRGAESTAIDTA